MLEILGLPTGHTGPGRPCSSVKSAWAVLVGGETKKESLHYMCSAPDNQTQQDG